MTPLPQTDTSIPFLLPQVALRGRLTRLEGVTSKILTQHRYPFPVGKVLAELLAAGATLSGLLKFQGVFTLQTKTEGPINFSVVDVTHEGGMRGYVQVNKGPMNKNLTFKELMGKGYLAFTIDQGIEKDRYQGIVALDHDTLPKALEHYFEQSEQLTTRLLISSEKTKEGRWKSSALLLQQMPSEEVSEETWNLMDSLFATISPSEFLDFSTHCEDFLYRLFHEVGVTVFPPLFLHAKCRCSKKRIRTFLESLKPEELEDLLKKGQLQMTCEFCNHKYTFSRTDLMTVH